MTNNRVVIACLLSWLLFPLIWWLPRLIAFDFINAFGLTFGATVLWRYAPPVGVALWKIVRAHLLNRGDMLNLGIWATWVAMVSRTVRLEVWRWYGGDGLNGLEVVAIAWVIITGGACHILSSVSPDEPPTLGYRLIGWSLAAGWLLGAALATGRYVAE